MTTTTQKCAKCKGTGRIAHFAMIENGICFSCDGTGVVAVKTRKVRNAKPWKEIEVARLIGGVPFADKPRAAAHAKELGISRMSYRTLATMHARSQKITRERWEKMRK